MLVLPTVILVISGICGAGGIAFGAKGMVDSLDASATNRYVQEKNEQFILRFHAVSENLNASLENLGKQRMAITKNFSVFIEAFERIQNRPEFSEVEDPAFPQFDFNEIKNVSVVTTNILGAAVGAIGGSVMAAAAASGTTAAVMALGTASTGTKIAELTGAAATKAAMAALGGGSLAAGGGGIALGTVVLNAATLGVGFLIEGLAMAYAGSVSKKHADEAKNELQKNEVLINSAISMQIQVNKLANDMRRVSVELCNQVYKPLMKRMKNLVNEKTDWNTYTDEDKLLVENTILIVQVLHYLNTTPLYKVTKINDEGEVEEAIANNDEVKTALHNAKQEANKLEV